MPVKIYMIVFYTPTFNLEMFNRWITSSPYVLSYWNYLPLIYCIKSQASVSELRVHFEPFFNFENFLITEINPENMSGRLPQEAWPWFHQTIFPPKNTLPGGQPSTNGTLPRLK